MSRDYDVSDTERRDASGLAHTDNPLRVTSLFAISQPVGSANEYIRIELGVDPAGSLFDAGLVPSVTELSVNAQEALFDWLVGDPDLRRLILAWGQDQNNW